MPQINLGHGRLETWRPVNKALLAEHVKVSDRALPAGEVFSLAPAAYPTDGATVIMEGEGYLSPAEIDRSKELIPPTAFRESLPAFMAAPALRSMHRDPIGIWTVMVLNDKGLWGRWVAYDTEKGREAKELVAGGTFRGLSVGFNPLEWPVESPDKTYLIWPKVQIVEGSLVDARANLGANLEAVSYYAKQLGRSVSDVVEYCKAIGLELTDSEIQGAPGLIGLRKKGHTMPVKLAEVDGLTEKLEAVEQLPVRVKELGSGLEKMAVTLKNIQDAAITKETVGELKTLVEKAQGDFVTAKKGFDDEVAKLRARKTVVPALQIEMKPERIKHIVGNYTASEIKNSCPGSDADMLIAYQKSIDELVMVDHLMAAGNRSYRDQNRRERMKTLKAFEPFSEFSKALDTATAGEGQEFVPTEMSGNLIELVRLESLVAPLFREVTMPSESFILDVEGADTVAELAAQVTTRVAHGSGTDEQTPGTGNITLTAVKCKGLYQVSRELDEASAVAILPFAQTKIVRSIARAWDRAIINGHKDATSAPFDTGLTFGTTDFRRAWSGLRYHQIQIGVSPDGGSYNDFTLAQARGGMKKYGVRPSDLAIISSIGGYLFRMLIDIKNIQKLNEYGSNAVVLTGELGRYLSIPIIVSEWVPEDLNSAGIYSGAGNTYTTQLLVNRSSWIQGLRRGVETTLVYDPFNDVYFVIAYKRGDFKPTVTPSTSDVVVNGIIGVNSTAAAA